MTTPSGPVGLRVTCPYVFCTKAFLLLFFAKSLGPTDLVLLPAFCRKLTCCGLIVCNLLPPRVKLCDYLAFPGALLAGGSLPPPRWLDFETVTTVVF